MSNQEETNEMIGGAIARHLQNRDRQAAARDEDHLDPDTIAAFVEGRVEDSGANLITSHLVLCAACRRATARVMHLESAVIDSDPTEVPSQAPGGLRRFIDDLAARILPSSEGDVVFAYEDPANTQPAASEGDPTAEVDDETEKHS